MNNFESTIYLRSIKIDHTFHTLKRHKILIMDHIFKKICTHDPIISEKTEKPIHYDPFSFLCA